MKSVSEAHIGDTFFTDVSWTDIEPFEGYKPPQNMVFAGVYPVDPDNYDELQKAIEKLLLTDGSITFTFE